MNVLKTLFVSVLVISTGIIFGLLSHRAYANLTNQNSATEVGTKVNNNETKKADSTEQTYHDPDNQLTLPVPKGYVWLRQASAEGTPKYTMLHQDKDEKGLLQESGLTIYFIGPNDAIDPRNQLEAALNQLKKSLASKWHVQSGSGLDESKKMASINDKTGKQSRYLDTASNEVIMIERANGQNGILAEIRPNNTLPGRLSEKNALAIINRIDCDPKQSNNSQPTNAPSSISNNMPTPSTTSDQSADPINPLLNPGT